MSSPTATRRRIPGLHRYGPVLRAPHARPLVAGSLLGNVGEVGGAIAMLLAVRATYGSFGVAGSAVGISALAVAASRVLQGRLIDRHGLRAVFVPLAAVQLLVLGALAGALSAHAPTGLVLGLAALVGASAPAIPTATRLLWAALTDPGQRPTAYALDAMLAELSFMSGPALAALLAAAVSPAAALVTAGALTAAGALAIAGIGSTVGGSRDAAAAATASTGGRRAPLPRSLLALAVLAFMLALGLGGLEVAVPAFATAHAAPGATGLLLGVWATGSLLGGLAFGALRPARSHELRLLGCLVLSTATLVPLAFASSTAALAGLLVLAGVPIAPTLTTLFLLVDRSAPEGRMTESFAWIGSALPAGTACGTAFAGWIVAAFDVSASFVAATLLSVLTLVVAAFALRPRRRRASPHPAGGRARSAAGRSR